MMTLREELQAFLTPETLRRPVSETSREMLAIAERHPRMARRLLAMDYLRRLADRYPLSMS